MVLYCFAKHDRWNRHFHAIGCQHRVRFGEGTVHRSDQRRLSRYPGASNETGHHREQFGHTNNLDEGLRAAMKAVTRRLLPSYIHQLGTDQKTTKKLRYLA